MISYDPEFLFGHDAAKDLENTESEQELQASTEERRRRKLTLVRAVKQGIKNCAYVVEADDSVEQLFHFDKGGMFCEGYGGDDEPPERCRNCVFNQFYED